MVLTPGMEVPPENHPTPPEGVPADSGSPEAPQPERGRRWLLPVLSIAVTGAVLYWLARQNEGFSVEQFALLLRNADPLLLSAAALAGFAAFVLRALRWAALVRPYAQSVSVTGLLGNTLIGFAAVLLLGRPAELLRPYLIGRQIGAPFSSQVGTLFLERIYDLLAVLALGAWALATVDLERVSADSALGLALRAGGGMVLLAAVAAAGLLLLFTFASDFAYGRLRDALVILPEARREGANRLLQSFVNAVSVSRQPACFVRILLYTVLHWAVVGLSSWLVFLSFPESEGLGLAHSFRFLALLALASAVPIPGLAGAFFVVSTLLLTEWLRLPLEAASAVALAIWCVQLGLSLPLGAAAALRAGLNWRKIKNMKQEARL